MGSQAPVSCPKKLSRVKSPAAPPSSLYDIYLYVSQKIKNDNEKDGVELILKPTHKFRCLKCGQTYTFRYFAEKCKHENS